MKLVRKKVAFVIPSMSSGGMERVMSEVVAYFSIKQTLDCHLIVYSKSDIDFYKIPSNVLLYKPTFKFDDSRRLWSTIKTSYFLRSTLKRIKPDVVLSFGEYWNNFVLMSLYGLKIKIFVSDRSSPEKHLGIFHDFLRQLLYPTTTGVIVQTTKAKEIFKTKFKNKNIRVIGNPIRVIASNNELQKENIIVTVGRLISTKNFNRLINIFYRINNSVWKLVIVGGDSDKQTNSINLQAQIDNLGLSENIILAGIQENVEDYLLRSKIFAFTSSSEGFPNVIGEAMSAGLPVVSYDCVAGPSDMIEDGKNGFLIPIFDDLLFEEKLRYLMENDNVCASMGVFARKSIKRYSVESIGEQYYNFIIS